MHKMAASSEVGPYVVAHCDCEIQCQLWHLLLEESHGVFGTK